MRLSKAGLTLLLLLTILFPKLAYSQSILVGLDADLSSGSARAGEAIRRGALLAMDEINAKGGALGRPLELTARDHHGIPNRGKDNVEALAADPNVVAILGGLHTPVAMHELPTVHEHGVPFLIPWAAGTPVVDNKFEPNFVFRVSVRDQFAGGFLVDRAVKRGFKKLALLLERTGWGRSNEKAMKSALDERGLEPAAVNWFHWGEKNMERVVGQLAESGAQAVLLVGNAPEGLKAAKAMAALPKDRRLPIISHWGITGGRFAEEANAFLSEIDLTFLQTFSFFDPPFPDRAEPVVRAYAKKFPDAKDAKGIFAPVGTAHAYDLIHLLAKAIEGAGSVDRDKVRQALETLPRHEGLVRDYSPPFTPERHDALDAGDFNLARYGEGGTIWFVK